MFTLIMPYITRFATSVIVIAVMLGSVYVKGRHDGAEALEVAVAEERARWQVAVSDITAKHQKEVKSIVNEYSRKTASFKQEIDKVKNTNLVSSYIPSASDTKVTNGFVELHNRAAIGNQIDVKPKANAYDQSDKSLSLVASTVIENYYQCNNVSDRLNALQQIVVDFQKKQKEMVK